MYQQTAKQKGNTMNKQDKKAFTKARKEQRKAWKLERKQARNNKAKRQALFQSVAA